MAANTDRTSPTVVVARLVAAILGGYAFSSGIAAFVAVALSVALGMSRADAALTAAMPAFLIYLAAAIWAFAERSIVRLYQVLFVGAVLLFVAAYGLMYLV
jgi:hypothetical protein